MLCDGFVIVVDVVIVGFVYVERDGSGLCYCVLCCVCVVVMCVLGA